MDIVIHGATGSQGASIATAFSDHTVRPLSRATGADLLDRASLESAYAGADAVVLTLPVVYDERVLWMADNAARAAEAAGIRHLVVNASGAVGPQRTGMPFQDARVIASEAAVPVVTVLAPATTYLENLSAPWSAERIARDGVIAYPVPGEATLAWVATADVGVAALRAVEDRVGGWFFLPGVPLTGNELAAELGSALGRELRWELVAPRDYCELLRPHLGDHAAEGTAAVYEYIASVPAPALPDPGPAVEALGWEPRSVAEWAAEVTWLALT
jgi:nucleoside-diphosphate-sugar epimerase